MNTPQPCAVTVMPPHLVRLLRAGEVVGSMTSAVKELIENSLDAGAARVSVFIDSTGEGTVTVEDDGWGMTRDDLALCLLPHASSKTTDERNIDCPRWLGFRGEALAALVSACARVHVHSRRLGSDGWCLSALDGTIGDMAPVSMVHGTRVVIQGLHAAAPARRAMLKGASRQAALVRKMMEHVSLSSPGVHWNLHVNGRQTLLLKPAPLHERITSLRADTDGLDIDIEQGGWEIRGRLFPGHARVENRWIIAGRAVQRSTVFAAALRSAGRSMVGGNGIYSFWGTIDVPAGCVLHNVHAAKEEVAHTNPAQDIAMLHSMLLTSARPATGMGYAHSWEGDGLLPVSLESGTGPLGTVLAVAHDAYIVALSGQGLVLVDAHAAHERILLETIRSVPEPLTLTKPAVVILAADEMDTFEGGRDVLESMGWGFVELDGNAVGVVMIPNVLSTSMVTEAFKAALHALSEGRATVEERLADMACRHAWRHGAPLDHETAERLLRTMETTPSSAVCNHGRPTCVRLPQEAMAKLFGR